MIGDLKVSAPVSPCVEKRSNKTRGMRGTCGGFDPTVSSHLSTGRPVIARGRKGWL